MEFRIADTFTNSLARLTTQEQKAVKTTAFDLQLNPTASGFSFHKLDRAKDQNFWSVRVNADIRLIVHRTATSLLLCYVDHHDKAYGWAERRKIEIHPKTGAAQLIEIRERIEEIRIQRVEEVEPAPKPAIFSGASEEELLGYGVPPEWLADVRRATEDSLFDLADHLPQEAAEALLDLATGTKPQKPSPAKPADPFSHPDAQRRFRVLTNVEELERALNFPWEKWAVFLHPGQRALVERSFSGPARISGSAGTGKTVVALHRAVHLARTDPQAHVLLTTFSSALAGALKARLAQLVGNEPAVHVRITVEAIHDVALRLYAEEFGQPRIASENDITALFSTASPADRSQFTPKFLFNEWTDVVDAWHLESWEAYRDVARLGRKTRVGGKQREVLWTIFSEARAALSNRGIVTWADIFSRVAFSLPSKRSRPYAFVVADESQDLGVAALRFLAALGGDGPNGLFFAGDLGQRIFQTPFSWKALGVDVRGRSATLRVNYRTSHQIRSQADRLLPKALADVDGLVEERGGTVSVFNGPVPRVQVLRTEAAERDSVSAWIGDLLREGYRAEEIGIFVRSEAELDRARQAVRAAKAVPSEVGDAAVGASGKVAVSTMHLAKGLEFRAVAVMACDDDVLPQQARIEAVTDESDLEEVYNTERHLLYVACTRARDRLLVTGVEPGSEFLGDLLG